MSQVRIKRTAVKTFPLAALSPQYDPLLLRAMMDLAAEDAGLLGDHCGEKPAWASTLDTAFDGTAIAGVFLDDLPQEELDKFAARILAAVGLGMFLERRRLELV